MNKTNSGFLAFLGMAVVIALGVYVLAPDIFKTNPELTSQPVSKSNMVDATVPAQDAPSAGQGIETEAAKADSSAATAPDPAADSWITPSFDLLRVEPDGSTVIAGRAEPGATLNIMNGEAVIASTQVGPAGDFAVVLDAPLAPGDYQLTLRIIGKDGAIRQSEEVATVSIPENAGGELLAMVSKPGKASRIIAQPTAPAAEKPAEVAAATPEAAGSEAPAAGVTDQAAGEAGTESAAAAAVDPAPETKTEMVAAAPLIQTPALPEASLQLMTSAPAIVSDGGAAASSETAVPTGTETGSEVAVATPEAATQAETEAMPVDANVRVDAVEIEGDRIFIAGSATPGYRVQVAADGVVIGVAEADETGRFIVEATSQLTVGDHIINADLLDKAGDTVLLRATVPFNRPAGEALAAVAPAEPAVAAPEAAEPATAAAEPAEEASPAAEAAETAAPAVPEALTVPDIASLSKMREGAFEALAKLKEMVSAEDKPDPASVAAMLEDAVGKLKSAAMADLPEGSSAEAMAIAQSMRIQAEAALAALMPGAADTAAGDPAQMSEILKRAESALAEPADMAVAATDLIPADPGQSGSAPKTILQAPLASTPGAVIIRRGDTLWQISRRTYGEGVRYTTIYVANRSQIQNPDRIKPGQVFSVPENPLDNAEEMHQQLLGKGKKL